MQRYHCATGDHGVLATHGTVAGHGPRGNATAAALTMPDTVEGDR